MVGIHQSKDHNRLHDAPTATVEAILGLQSLILYIKQKAGLAAVHLKLYNLWQQMKTPHSKILHNFVFEEPLLKWIEFLNNTSTVRTINTKYSCRGPQQWIKP